MMATTSIIVEIFIIGFFTSIWIFLFCLRLSLFDLESIQQFISKFDSTTLFLSSTAMFYQLGILMNRTSHRITRPLGESKYRNEIIPNVIYDEIKAKVEQDGSEAVAKSLTLQLSFVRLTRAGFVNFLLIAVGVLLLRDQIKMSYLVPLFISVFSLLAWRGAYRGYYRRIAYAYSILTNVKVNESIAQQKIGFFYETRNLIAKLRKSKVKKELVDNSQNVNK
jgi:hypothetical protein